MASNPPQLSRRPDIDGLRAIAIIPVVLFHADVPGFQGGFVGVDVFFVISGYLITRIIAKEISATGSFRFWNFYARRARRLLPAALLVIVVSLAVSALILPPLQQDKLFPSALAALFYVSNLYYWVKAADYFDPVTESDIYLHTWSLGVEEQFYLVWPILMLLAFRFRSGAFVWIAAALLSTFFLSAWISNFSQPAAFFLSPLRAWEFAAGALAGTLPDRRRSRALPIAVIGALLIFAAIFGISTASTYPGLVAAVPVAGTAALLISGSSDHLVSRFLRTRPMRLIGYVSYSWYLWHWPVLILGADLIGDPSLAERLGLALVSLALAGATYVLVETPVRTSAYLAPRPFHSIGLGAIGSVVSASILALLWWQAKEDMYSPPYRHLTLASMDKVRLPGCMTDYADSRLRICSFGSGERTVAVIGDSHAQMWLPAILDAAKGYRA